MKYTSINKINDFEFHDAQFSFIGFCDGDLAVSAKHLNIHKTALENPFDDDMEIKEAKITFKGFRAVSFKKSVKYAQDENGT